MDGDMGMEGTMVWRGHGYERDMGMERRMVWSRHGYGGDMGMEREQGIEGT